VPPVYVAQYRAKASLPGDAEIRVIQNSALGVPIGGRRDLLVVRGFGTLTMLCDSDLASTFRLSHWAQGEGPPVVQHVETQPGKAMVLVPFTEAGGPITLSNRSSPQTFTYWQITIIASAFDANVTIATLATRTPSGCDFSAEATTISHGQFYRYVP